MRYQGSATRVNRRFSKESKIQVALVITCALLGAIAVQLADKFDTRQVTTEVIPLQDYQSGLIHAYRFSSLPSKLSHRVFSELLEVTHESRHSFSELRRLYLRREWRDQDKP